MEPIINAHAPEFTVQAFQNGQFKTVSSKDIEGKWALFFFYPAKYTMLADPTGVLSRGFGVYKEDEGVAYRGTFLVNPEGLVKIAEIQDNSIGRNADELVRKVEAALFVASHDGEVCPAKWKQGGETLKPSIDLVGKL